MGWRLNGLISKEKMNSCSLNDMKTMWTTSLKISELNFLFTEENYICFSLHLKITEKLMSNNLLLIVKC